MVLVASSCIPATCLEFNILEIGVVLTGFDHLYQNIIEQRPHQLHHIVKSDQNVIRKSYVESVGPKFASCHSGYRYIN